MHFSQRSNTHLMLEVFQVLSCPDVNDVLLWIILMFLFIRHPFTAEQPLVGQRKAEGSIQERQCHPNTIESH